jgi:hypothetical protein
MISAFLILVVLALLLAVAALVWPQKGFLIPVAILFLAVALLIGHSAKVTS